MMTSLTHQDAIRLLHYNSETGKLFWLERTPDMFSNGRFSAECECRRWNTRFSGKEAFTSVDGKSYKHGHINGKLYGAHRLIWLLVFGEWPSEDIDHVNGIKTDNRLVNLRDVSHAENGRNQRLSIRNSSGVVGVSWCRRTNKWHAQIKFQNRSNHLGFFEEFDAAVAIRKAAEIKYGFHPNHGRAA